MNLMSLAKYEQQLKWINLIFMALYGYGIADYFL
jgi:hypothetical protein